MFNFKYFEIFFNSIFSLEKNKIMKQQRSNSSKQYNCLQTYGEQIKEIVKNRNNIVRSRDWDISFDLCLCFVIPKDVMVRIGVRNED